MELDRKLSILADAAKYDASCASSGAPRRSAARGTGMGSTSGMGICHSYTPDGRCVSLLKILLTNFCLYDCVYCVNRRSSDVPRARFAASEVVDLTLSFYRRNYIEGLFLSSGIIQTADYTMEQLVEVARSLREDHDFRGYIHLKTIPEASADLITAAGRYADRLSVNIELPSRDALTTLAPEKSDTSIKRSMATIRVGIETAKAGGPRAPGFSPAHGVFAPHSKLRAAVTPAGRGKGKKAQGEEGTEKPTTPRYVAMNWAMRLKRVFGIDIEACARCGGKLAIIASIEEPAVIAKILAHLERTVPDHYQPELPLGARAPPAQSRLL